MKRMILHLLLVSLMAVSVAQTPQKSKTKKMETLVVGGGCFWCVEVLFEMLKGVTHVESGYAGGKQPNVTYREVGTGNSGHAEVIKVQFDPSVITRKDLLNIFFTAHDPTTRNQQGNDYGPQYRSVIFFESDSEKKLAQDVIAAINKAKIWPKPIVTTIEPLKNYTQAEGYHQDYFDKYTKASDSERANMNAGYCQVIIEPKVKKFREKYKHLLK